MAYPQKSVKDCLDLISKFDGESIKLSNFIKACESELTLMPPNTMCFYNVSHKDQDMRQKASYAGSKYSVTFNKWRIF